MESSLEVTLWFIFSMTVGLLILNFTTNIDYQGFSDTIKSFFSNEKTPQEKLKGKNLEETIIATLDLWKECGFGEIKKSTTIRYNDTINSLNKSSYFRFIKDINLCHIISSTSENCGNKEELNLTGNINGDKFINVECDPSTLPSVLRITY